MKILTTKLRPGSLSTAIAQCFEAEGHEVVSLPENLDILHAGSWGSGQIPKDADVLINCVGVTDNDPVGQWGYTRVDRVVTVNLTGAIVLTEAFMNATKESVKPKLIVHIGSAGARKVFTNCAAYCASKAGLVHYIECAGYEFRDGRFSIIGIHPDNLQGTPMTMRVQRELKEVRGMSDQQVQAIYGRAVHPFIVANTVHSIVSEAKSAWSFLNGENIFLGAGDKRGS